MLRVLEAGSEISAEGKNVDHFPAEFINSLFLLKAEC
jgi:hypothetical protein